jgi:DNA-binding NarL/FixJ family response regulator
MFMRLLIVDDHAPFRAMVKNFFPEAEMHECSSGAEAFQCYVQQRPDWVLMDFEMRGVDGLAATRLIRAAYPEACIVILTQHSEPELREAAREAGAAHYVLKENLSQVPKLIAAAAL